ncbi:hypothetical protein Tco_0555826 [Tanacetum coccineum]
MDNPNITMEEYIKLHEEKALSRGETFNWQTATYGKMEYCEDEGDCFTNFESEFPAIVLDDTSREALSWERTVSPLNDNEIDFRISFDESDNEDYTIIYDENSFSFKIIYVNDLKMDFENDNDKVNMPLFSTPEPEVSYSNDLDFFKDFENEFPANVYNDALTSKSDFLTEPTESPQHIDEFNLKNETSLSKCDEKEQNILYFNDLFPFNVIYPDDLKSDTDNDNDKIDIEQPLGDMSVIPSPNVINVDTQGSNKLLETIQNLRYSRPTSMEMSSSKLVPKVVPQADKITTSRQELELLFHHHITMLRRPYALSWKPCQGDSLNLLDHRIHKDGDGDASFQLESDSLPHAHAQTTKTYYKHQDSRITKAQELKTKTSAQTLIYKIFLQRYQVYQGRLLASFQDDAKYEHVGQDIRS